MNCPTCSWPICWRGISDTKKIWWIGGSALQFEREEAGPDPFTARPFWQGRHTRDGGFQDQSGDAGGDDRHNPAGQLLHEPLQEIGIHSLQWRAASPQLTSERCSPRLASASFQNKRACDLLGTGQAF